MSETCETCAYRSDGINTLSLDYCYCLDKQVDRGDSCPEWRASLRETPLEGPEAQLIKQVRVMDREVEG